jgi:hypothetical protein
VLERKQITMPCAAFELTLDSVLRLSGRLR